MAKKANSSAAKAVKKQPTISDIIELDGKIYQMMCVDIRQDGTVSEIPMRIKEFVDEMERDKISRTTSYSGK